MKKLVIIIKNLTHGHVRVHGEGKPEGGLLHLQQLQQVYLHVQQRSSLHLKLKVVFLSVFCPIHLSFIIKEPPKQPCIVVFHHEYVGLLHYWLDLPRPVTLIHQKVHGLRRVLGVKKAPKLLAPSLRYELLKVASKYVTLPLTL